MLRWDDIDLPLRVRRGMPPRRRVDAARWGFSRLSGVFRAWPRVKTRQQNGQNAGQEYAVKSSGTADRGYRRAEATHLVKVGEISADQRAEAASDKASRADSSRDSITATMAVTRTGMNIGMSLPTAAKLAGPTDQERQLLERDT